jgi:seryl-tRNA synthetase
MLDLKNLVQETARVEASLKKRGAVHLLPLLTQLVEADRERRQCLQAVETLKAKRNNASQEIAKKKKEKIDDTALLEEMKRVSQEIKGLDEKVGGFQAVVDRLLEEFPNLLDDSVPEGKSAEQNLELRRWGDLRQFSFKPKTHDELGEALGILNFKKAGEVTGARFVFLKGLAARLERALIQFMLDTHGPAGYEEMLPPLMVNRDALRGTGQLPKFEEDVFKVEKFEYFLIPTAEVPVTNYHRQEILEEKDLPKKYMAYTPCFRSEAGSYGKDTKGLKRQHQFNKVELVKFTVPETSVHEHESLTANAEKILQLLGLPYRVMLLCGGDTGFSSSKTYDLEVWSPGANAYMEISSCSNFADFQARRAGIRYRDAKTGKVHFVHTLNGSGLAVGRTLLAILENYQKEDGTFEIPKVLSAYFRY